MKINFLFAITLLILSSCSVKDPYSADKLSDDEKLKFIRETVRYTAKLPPHATHQTKFDTAFNAYYKFAEKEYDVRGWFPTDSITYFLMTRQARSITPMREGIGGKMKYDENGQLIVYEEVFRTWKMPDSLLVKRGRELFEAMVKGKDLTIYTPKYSGDKYIEYPDTRFTFDKIERKWRDKVFDSLTVETGREN